MSGRSAYVRKKITNEATKDGKSATRNRTKSATAHDRDDVTISDFPLPVGSSVPLGTGVGTTNARFLKFSEPMRDSGEGYPQVHRDISAMSVSSGGSGGSGRRHDSYGEYQDDYVYDRPRKPTLKTEDVSGIERSGLRSLLDKKSDGVRRGLAKTFTFKRKDRDDRRGSLDRSPELRPPSVATVRPPTQTQYREMETVYDVPEPYYEESALRPMQRQNPGPDLWDPATPAAPPPSGKLPPVPPPSMAPPIKRWIGSGRPVQRWNKLRKDPELWDPNGDVLVFFGHKGQQPRPNPSFRLSSHIIEATESRYLITMLREGSTEEDICSPPSPQGAPPMLRQDKRRPPVMGRGGHPTPPVSEDTSLGEADGQISYEMYFPTPVNMSKVDQLRHHITTRNFFALLYHASIVGISLHQALTDLHTRLDAYLPSNSDNVAMLVNYLTARSIDDVRNDAETAVGLLAWSEGADVRWEEGWRECFLHAAGMFSQIEGCTDFRSLTPITRALLERACLETHLRVQAAEERLLELQCHEMWPTTGPVANGPAKAAADRLQKFLLSHYTRMYGSWPPLPLSHNGPASPHGPDGLDGEDIWLSRTVAQALQRDFGALYDYLVNRDIVWDVSEARSGRKWMMVSEGGNRGFDADTPELPMTDILIEFDNKMRFPHVPHPYPLVPESIAPVAAAAPASAARETSASMFRSARSKTQVPSQPAGGQQQQQRSGAMERRVQLAYTEATNIYSLGSDLTHSELVDAFVKFEKTDRIGEVDPAVARRGRWVLIYGILQTLASVSVDSPGVKFREEVPYHLSPRLKGTKIPPWKGAASAGKGKGKGVRHQQGAGGTDTMDEAAHEMSHCWLVAGSWNASGMQTGSSAEEEDGPWDHSGSPVVPGGGTFLLGGPGPGGNVAGSGLATPAQSVYGSAPSVMSESDTQSRASSRPAQSLPMRRKEFGGYHEGTAGVYGRGANGHPEGDGRSQARFRDFDLDVIDDAEP